VLAIKDARVLSMNEAGSFEKATVVVDGDSIVEHAHQFSPVNNRYILEFFFYYQW
jgi:hypothetical protein